jgi:hypothetical protein
MYKTEDQEIIDFFTSFGCGTLCSVPFLLRGEIEEIARIQGQGQRFSGTLLLFFKDEESVEKALEANEQTLATRVIGVERLRKGFEHRPLSTKPEGCCTVFVGEYLV